MVGDAGAGDSPAPGVHVVPGGVARAGRLAAAAAPEADRWGLVADATVFALHGAACAASFAAPPAVATFPAGEGHKTRETWAALTDACLAAGLGRGAALLTLGGGVASDLGGFVAATFARGIPVVHVPTSLLAMVDAAIGGKTGVDVPAGKNLVGAFHPPAAVVVDPLVLGTLPDAERRAGFAEMLKHGVVADAAHFHALAEAAPALLAAGAEREAPLAAAIARSIALKAAIVAADARDAGRRAILNFGHTVAHAVEAASGYAVRHGEAVAIGMVVEATVAERLGLAAAGTAATIRAAVGRAGLPDAVPPGVPGDALRAAMRHDKKGRAGRVACALPAGIGEMAGGAGGWVTAVPDEAWTGLLPA